MRQEHNVDAQRAQVGAGPLPTVVALPVVTDEDRLERDALGGLHLVQGVDHDALVDLLHGAQDLGPVLGGDDGRLVLVGLDQLVGVHAHDQVVAVGLGVLDQVEVTNVEHVERPLGVADHVVGLGADLGAVPVTLVLGRQLHVIPVDLRQVGLVVRRAVELHVAESVGGAVAVDILNVVDALELVGAHGVYAVVALVEVVGRKRALAAPAPGLAVEQPVGLERVAHVDRRLLKGGAALVRIRRLLDPGKAPHQLEVIELGLPRLAPRPGGRRAVQREQVDPDRLLYRLVILCQRDRHALVPDLGAQVVVIDLCLVGRQLVVVGEL